MEVTSRKNNGRSPNKVINNFANIDWFEANREAQELSQTKFNTSHMRGYLDFLWPMTTEYYSPTQSIFLLGVPGLETLNEHPVWFARDGFIPLLWFFKLYPTPQGFKRHLMVYDGFGPFVPSAWRKQVGTYRLESVNDPKLKKPSKLLLLGLVNEVICSLDHIESYLKKIQNVYKKELTGTHKMAFFLQKYGFGEENRHEFYPEYMNRISAALGTDNFKAIRWVNFDGIPSFNDFTVVDLNQNLLCADNSMIHSALRRGAKLLEQTPTPADKKRKFIPLSPHHGFSIQEKLSGTCVLEEHHRSLKEAETFLKQFDTAMRSDANLNLPWPSWFVEWGKIASHKASSGTRKI